jgi:peptide/bleomycin uptake transporter
MDSIFPLILLGPTVIAGVITLGIFTQINNAFDKVKESFQYLVNSWSTIVDLLSVYKRLRTFEMVIHGAPPPPPELEDARPVVA